MKTRTIISFLFFLAGVFTLGSYFASEFKYNDPIPSWRWISLSFLTLYFFINLGNEK